MRVRSPDQQLEFERFEKRLFEAKKLMRTGFIETLELRFPDIFELFMKEEFRWSNI